MDALLYEKLTYTAKSLLVVACCLMVFSIAKGQDVIPFDSDQWALDGDYKLEDYKGAQALLLSPGASAVLPGISMKDGIIEYDVAFGENRGFIFMQFRRQDNGNYEEFYFRPHQSGNPDAMQYTPVYNGINGWQLYTGDNHSIAYRYKDNEWMHIKMVLKDSRMELFIDNMNIPVLDVFDLKREPAGGSIAFISAMTEARIANVTLSQPQNITFVSKERELPSLEPEVVASWEVSTTFNPNVLGTQLGKDLADELTWKTLPVEYSGIANLAQVGVRGDETNAVFARFTVNSSSNQVKQLLFGYSDLARVYVNGKAVYEGQNIFRSRDYRYLGTVGYFDSVFIDLKRGDNEIVFAVTENFGGWGVKARFADLDKISFTE